MTIVVNGNDESVGFSGNTNISVAQKEAAVAAMQHMNLDITEAPSEPDEVVDDSTEVNGLKANSDDLQVNLDDIPF